MNFKISDIVKPAIASASVLALALATFVQAGQTTQNSNNTNNSNRPGVRRGRNPNPARRVAPSTKHEFKREHERQHELEWKHER
jgi:hypothetical protein